MNSLFLKSAILTYFIFATVENSYSDVYDLPELYQDVIVKGEVIQKGIRNCEGRYKAIRGILDSLPESFKALDIGASQGYFSFRMAEDYQARCTMIEGGYPISDIEWTTGDFLKHLCEQNHHLKNLSLLQTQIFAEELTQLGKFESFDLVIAFAVIHHMKHSPDESYEVYLDTIDAILSLAPVVLIENPVNTGDHTQYIRKALQERGGKVIYESLRGTLIYEIYLFDKRNTFPLRSQIPNLSDETLKTFNGSYSSIVNE